MNKVLLAQNIAVIGHTEHCLSTITRQMLANKGLEDIIVIDENNLEETKQKLQEMRPKENFLLKAASDFPQLEYIQPMPGKTANKRIHKPNTGLKLGSYKTKTKKQFKNPFY